MDKTLERTLTQAGVSAAAIALLDEQELTSEAALKRGFTFEQFCGMGIKAGSARVLADLYPAPVVAAIPAPATPLYLGREPLEQQVRAAAAGDAEAIAQLLERFGTKTVFVRDLSTGKMHVEASLACIAYVGIDSPIDHWENMPTESLSQILASQRRYANPLTGTPLVPGDSWLEVDIVRRTLAAFAVLTLAINPLGIDEETILEQLKRPELTGRWLRVANAYEVASRRHEPAVQEAERRLYVDHASGTPAIFEGAPATRGTADAAATRLRAQVSPKLGVGVPADFRRLVELYLTHDEKGMHQFLYARGLFLTLSDLERRTLDGVPLEALCLLRAGSSWSTFESAARTLERLYGIQPIIAYLGRVDGDFYEGMKQCYPDLADWCGHILYHSDFGVAVSRRPRPAYGDLAGWASAPGGYNQQAYWGE